MAGLAMIGARLFLTTRHDGVKMAKAKTATATTATAIAAAFTGSFFLCADAHDVWYWIPLAIVEPPERAIALNAQRCCWFARLPLVRETSFVFSLLKVSDIQVLSPRNESAVVKG